MFLEDKPEIFLEDPKFLEDPEIKVGDGDEGVERQDGTDRGAWWLIGGGAVLGTGM